MDRARRARRRRPRLRARNALCPRPFLRALLTDLARPLAPKTHRSAWKRTPPPRRRAGSAIVCAVDERFEMAFFAADQAARGLLSRDVFARVFGKDLASTFPRELDHLLRTGLLAESAGVLRKPPRLDFQAAHPIWSEGAARAQHARAPALRDGQSGSRHPRSLWPDQGRRPSVHVRARGGRSRWRPPGVSRSSASWWGVARASFKCRSSTPGTRRRSHSLCR